MNPSDRKMMMMIFFPIYSRYCPFALFTYHCETSIITIYVKDECEYCSITTLLFCYLWSFCVLLISFCFVFFIYFIFKQIFVKHSTTHQTTIIREEPMETAELITTHEPTMRPTTELFRVGSTVYTIEERRPE
jgi:hypothetical protein